MGVPLGTRIFPEGSDDNTTMCTQLPRLLPCTSVASCLTSHASTTLLTERCQPLNRTSIAEDLYRSHDRPADGPPSRSARTASSPHLKAESWEKIPPGVLQVMFDGSKKGLDWKKRFQAALDEEFQRCGVHFRALMPLGYRTFVHDASQRFIDAFRRIEMRDTLYEDVRDTETFRQLATRASAICLWTTGDIPNRHQRSKILNSRLLEYINAGAAADFTRRSDIISDDKPAELATELEAFRKSGDLKQLLVVVFDDSEKSMKGSDKAISEWLASLADPPALQRLFVRALRGKAKADPWTFPSRTAADLRELLTLLDSVVAENPGLSRDNVIVFLDFDGTLCDNALVRERQERVARQELAAASLDIARQFADRFIEKSFREDAVREITQRLESALAGGEVLSHHPSPHPVLPEPAEANHPEVVRLANAVEIKMLRNTVRIDKLPLDVNTEITRLRDILLYQRTTEEDAHLIRKTLAMALARLGHDDLAQELLETALETDPELFLIYYTLCFCNDRHDRIVRLAEKRPNIVEEGSCAIRARVAAAHLRAACTENDPSLSRRLAFRGTAIFAGAADELKRLSSEGDLYQATLSRHAFSAALTEYVVFFVPRIAEERERARLSAMGFEQAATTYDRYRLMAESAGFRLHHDKRFCERYLSSAAELLSYPPQGSDVERAHELLGQVVQTLHFAAKFPDTDQGVKQQFAQHLTRFLDRVEQIDPSYDGTALRSELNRHAQGLLLPEAFARAIRSGSYAQAIEAACHASYDRLLQRLIRLYLLQAPVDLGATRVISIPSGIKLDSVEQLRQIVATCAHRQRAISVSEMIEPYRSAMESQTAEGVAYLEGIIPPGALIESRIKSATSLLLKMLAEKKDRLTDITDVLAFRVLTRTEAQMRSLYSQIRADMQGGIIKEWITVGTPTRRLYRSMDITGLHPKTGALLQVQVRTRAMHEAFFFQPSNERLYKIESAKKLWETYSSDPLEQLRLFGRMMTQLHGAHQIIGSLPAASLDDVQRAYSQEIAGDTHILLTTRPPVTEQNATGAVK